jgi:hypothetical protein
MESLSKIRSELRSYVDGKIAYAAFRLWMVGVYAEYAESAQDAAPELALCRAVEWECAQYSEENGISEDILRGRIRMLAEPLLAAVASGDVQFVPDWRVGASPTSAGEQLRPNGQIEVAA